MFGSDSDEMMVRMSTHCIIGNSMLAGHNEDAEQNRTKKTVGTWIRNNLNQYSLVDGWYIPFVVQRKNNNTKHRHIFARQSHAVCPNGNSQKFDPVHTHSGTIFLKNLARCTQHSTSDHPENPRNPRNERPASLPDHSLELFQRWW